MKRYVTVFSLLASALLATSCLQQQKQQRDKDDAQQTEEPRALPPLHLGAVHQVYPDQGFALLRIIGPMPGPGATLITHPANGSTERIGNLCITTQQPSRDGFVAADIRSGVVVKGDRVFRYRNIASAPQKDVIAIERPAITTENTTDTTSAAQQADAEFEAFVNAPALEDEPAMQEEPIATGREETSVLPDSVPPASGSDSGAPAAPAQAPDYLDSIPDNIDDWDSM